MILTHVTAKGPLGFVFLTRMESPLRLVIEKSDRANGYRVLHGFLHLTSSLDDVYQLLTPLLYGGVSPENWQAAELEAIVRPLLAHQI